MWGYEGVLRPGGTARVVRPCQASGAARGAARAVHLPRALCGPRLTVSASTLSPGGAGGMHKLFSSPPSTLSPGGVGGTHKLFGVCGVCVRSRSVCGACGAQGQSGQVPKRNIRTMKVHNFWHPDRYKPAGYPTILKNNGRVSLFWGLGRVSYSGTSYSGTGHGSFRGACTLKVIV